MPDRYAGERVLLRAYPWHVEVSDGQTVVACHGRLYGKDGEQLDPLHYLRVLERKPGGFDLARPIQRWRANWPPIYEQYLAALRQARPDDATREFVRILQLHAQFTAAQVAAALDQALGHRCWSAEGIEVLLRQALAPSAPAPTGALTDAAGPGGVAMARLVIPPPDLTRFDRLLRPEEVAR